MTHAKAHVHSLKCINRAGELICADSFVQQARMRGEPDSEKTFGLLREVDQDKVVRIRADEKKRASGTVVIPCYRFSAVQQDPPHRKIVAARHVDNHGTIFELCTGYVGKARDKFYLYAHRGGYRSSDSISTTVRAKAAQWRLAIESGNVAVSEA